jgi:hypothetical protein
MVSTDVKDEEWATIHEIVEEVCQSGADDDDDDDELGDIDALASRAQKVFMWKDESVKASILKKLESSFNSCDQRIIQDEKNKELETIEDFILSEQNFSRQRRALARKLEASEEMRLAADVAQLLGFREGTKLANAHEEMQQKISDAEWDYVSRKMVFAKAAQIANAECRVQFARVREFFQRLHQSRLEVLRRQYKRSLKLQVISNRIRCTDARVVALEQQIDSRLYHKKKTDLNELHLAQNLEEAVYLESTLNLLDEVLAGKETAARALFELQIKGFNTQREANAKREVDLALFNAAATLELAQVVAQHTEEDKGNEEDAGQVEENVAAMERRKDFYASASSKVTSMSQLFDMVLWSVATSELGLTSSCWSGSLRRYVGVEEASADTDGLEEMDDMESSQWKMDGTQHSKIDSTVGDDSSQWKKDRAQHSEIDSTVWDDSSQSKKYSEMDSAIGDQEDGLSPDAKVHVKQLTKELGAKEKALIEQHDAEVKQERYGSLQSKKDGDKQSEMDSIVGDQEYLMIKRLSPAGNIHVKQLTKQLRAKEKALIEQHKAYAKQERHDYRIAARALKRKHQTIVDGLLERNLIERQELREAITQRVEKMVKRQETSIEQLRKKDVQVMQEALWAEDKRLADAETSSFVKAQALISAQVFHEVRNALSSVIAMSEMTSSLKTDLTISPIKLVSSMDDMLDQIKEVVYYARKF